jgi:hypothetical protein
MFWPAREKREMTNKNLLSVTVSDELMQKLREAQHSGIEAIGLKVQLRKELGLDKFPADSEKMILYGRHREEIPSEKAVGWLEGIAPGVVMLIPWRALDERFRFLLGWYFRQISQQDIGVGQVRISAF